MKHRFGPLFKYGIVGAGGTFIDVGSLYVFIDIIHLPLLLGTTLSFLLAVTNNFIFNKIWTFQNRSKNYRKLYIKFFIVSCVGLGLTNISMYIQVIILDIWYIFAKLITSGLVLTWNFLGNKYWTFQLKERRIQIPATFRFDLSIIIPAYNEEQRIKQTLLAVQDCIEEQNLNAEIIVIDDGSKDETKNVVGSRQKRMQHLSCISYHPNRGKGYAIRKGIETAQGSHILFIDADNSTPIEEFDRLKKALQDGYDIAIGSRYLKKNSIKLKQPWYRILIGRIGNILIRLFLISDVKDTQCGFKLFKHAIAKEIFSRQKVHRWGFDMEALCIAKSLDYKIVEVPVDWFNSAGSRFRPIKDAFGTFFELIYIKLNVWSGRYE